jgi:hypothetical protein
MLNGRQVRSAAVKQISYEQQRIRQLKCPVVSRSERGWVRAEERQQRRDESQATGKSKQNRGKQKGNGAKEKDK